MEFRPTTEADETPTSTYGPILTPDQLERARQRCEGIRQYGRTREALRVAGRFDLAHQLGALVTGVTPPRTLANAIAKALGWSRRIVHSLLRALTGDDPAPREHVDNVDSPVATRIVAAPVQRHAPPRASAHVLIGALAA